MQDIFTQMYHNKIFMVTLSSWVIAQSIKVVIGVIQEKRFDFRWFVGTGGMPSSRQPWALITVLTAFILLWQPHFLS